MPSQGVLNVLVKRYLDTSYPAAGAVFDGKCATGVPASQTLESIYNVEPVKAAAKKAVIPDDSSDDEPVSKPVAKKTASPKVAPKKVAADPDDSSADDVFSNPKIPLPTGAIGFKREREDDKEAKLAWTHVPGQRFQRIDPSKVKFTHDTLKDNSAIELAAQFRQNQEMMAVRGKEFNKHKQKNKGKLYAAGVEMSVRSYKFDDDSE